MKKSNPVDVVIAITHKCNARCGMCSIWQEKNPQDLPLEAFKNLNNDLKDINLSGGEPFLRLDLPKIVEIIKKKSPKAQIIISTNGLSYDLIVKSAKEIFKIDPKIGIRVSLDGLKDTHDKIRGIEGIYDQAIKSIRVLKGIGFTNLGIGFTTMKENYNQVKDVYKLAKDMGLQFSISVVQNSDIYFKKSDNEISLNEEVSKGLDFVIKKELKSWNVKSWFRAYYVYGLKYYLTTRKRLLPSGAGDDSLFIDATGDVYPSNLINIKIGNIKDQKLEDIYLSMESNKIAEKIADKRNEEPWTICTVRNNFRKNIFKIGFWILRNKFFKV